MHCKLKMLSNLNSYHQHCISAPLSEGIQLTETWGPAETEREREKDRWSGGAGPEWLMSCWPGILVEH